MTNGTTTTTIQRLDPEIESYKVGLLEDVQGFIRDRIESGVLPADFQISDLSGLETQAAGLAGGLGGYAVYFRWSRERPSRTKSPWRSRVAHNARGYGCLSISFGRSSNHRGTV